MRVSRLLAVPFLALAVSCGSTGAPKPDPTAKTSSAIINGQLDTTHNAVVALALQSGTEGGLCSGTIVKVDTTSKVGWILTAAHCVAIPPVFVIQGNDIQDPTATQYQVLDYTHDTRYDVTSMNAGQPYDFAVVRIAGVDSSTPTLPLAGASDGVNSGTGVTMVGYGRTLLLSQGMEDPRYRHVTTQTVADLGQSLGGSLSGKVLYYDQPTTGTCEGDSGGPDIDDNGKVVGVHSFITGGDCNGGSASGRVSVDLTYIDGELAKPAPADDCNFCTAVSNSGNQECALLTRACLSDKDCSAFYSCYQACNETASCRTSCLAKYPKAEGPLNAAASCSCNRTCVSECKGGLTCLGVPKCGYKFPAGDCSTCTEGACCQESLDCGADGECYLCLKNGDKDPGCASNAKRQALATCVAKSCNDQCANTGLTNGADAGDGTGDQGSSGDGTGATTTTTSGGCSTSPRGGSSSFFALALAALGLVAARRRRR
ncbi:MAG TPA: S1 family peptidase [Labilithrix sp.]